MPSTQRTFRCCVFDVFDFTVRNKGFATLFTKKSKHDICQTPKAIAPRIEGMSEYPQASKHSEHQFNSPNQVSVSHSAQAMTDRTVEAAPLMLQSFVQGVDLGLVTKGGKELPGCIPMMPKLKELMTSFSKRQRQSCCEAMSHS
eukprot:2771948-Amphidinium_carterae.1